MARPLVAVGETVSIMKGSLNRPILNKQLLTADKVSSSSLVFGKVLTNPQRKTFPCYK